MATKRPQPHSDNRQRCTAEVLLGAEQAASFCARLAAVFFDPDAKRAVVHEVRDAIRQAAERGGREPSEVEDDIFTGLMAEAARRARPPQRVESPGLSPPLLEDDALDQRILTDYPAPIARPYRALLDADSATGGFVCLIRVFEGLVHFLATVAVSAYHRSGLDLPVCNRQLVDQFLKRTWSTGDLFGLLRDTIHWAGDCGGMLPYAELKGYLFTAQGKPTASCAILEDLISVRNDWAHGGGLSDADFGPLLTKHRPRLEGELARMTWLAGWMLIRPVRIEKAAPRIVHWLPLMGESPRRMQLEPIGLARSDLDPETGLVRGENSLLLLAPKRDRYLPLFPLSLFSVSSDQGERRKGVYLLQRCHWEQKNRRRFLKEAHYIAYGAGLNHHSEQGGDPTARRIEQILERWEARLPKAFDPAEGLASSPSPPAEDPDRTLPEVRAEQERHLRSFVGREDFLERISAWIDAQVDGGYLLLLGPPGQGKSAVMAELARRESGPERGGCLFHMIRSDKDPLRFLPALISQATLLAGTRLGAEAYRGDIRDLRKELVRAFEAVRDGPGRGRVLVVIDALDELAEGPDRLEFLPQSLPRGVRMVLTCRRATPLVESLHIRLAGQLVQEDVPALGLADFRRMLERRLKEERRLEDQTRRDLGSQADLPGIFDRLKGNPLFLKLALDWIIAEAVEASRTGRRPGIDPAQFPQTLDAWFRGTYRQIGKRPTAQGPRGIKHDRQKLRLLKLLCVAREAIGYEELTGLMSAAGHPISLEACRDRIAEMSQYLLDAGRNRFKPWHQELADYVRRCELGEAETRDLEQSFCRWMETAGPSRYALRHRISHLTAAGQLERAAEFLTDLGFLEAKAEAGLVFELDADFARVVHDCPREDPARWRLEFLERALRLDLPFIARHPTTLFQCLWNRCWWYDSPEAALHYDPPRGGWPSGDPPWSRPEPQRLSTLLESWCAAKEARSPRFPWLRSLRPPKQPIGGAQLAILRGHDDTVWSVAYSPDGHSIASGSADKTARIWDAASTVEFVPLRGHEVTVLSLAYSPDGRHLVGGCWDHTIRLWDAQGGAELACLRGHKRPVMSVAYSPDGRYIVSGSIDQTVRLWDAADRSQVHCLSGHNDSVESVAFSPDGRRIVSGSNDRTVRVWEWDQDSSRESLCIPWHGKPVTSVAFSPDGRRIASGSEDQTVRVWDAASGSQLACLRGHEGTVQSVAWSPDGRHLVSGSKDRTVQVWDAQGGAEPARIHGHDNWVTCLAFSHDGRQLATGSKDCDVRVWDAAGGHDLAFLAGHARGVRCVAFSPDGRRIASGSADWIVRIWDATSRTVLARIEHPGPVTSVRFSPDGDRIVSRSVDETERVWDARSGECLEGVSGSADVPAAMTSEAPFRFRAVTRSGETAIEPAEGGDPIAWYPAVLDHIAAYPSSRTWAGSVSNHLDLIQLEQGSRALPAPTIAETAPEVTALGDLEEPQRMTAGRWSLFGRSASIPKTIAGLIRGWFD